VPHAKSLEALLRERLGATAHPEVNRTLTSVGVAAAQLFRQDPTRVAFLVVNLSANSIYISPEPTVSATAGILLGANGGAASAIWDEDFDLVGLEWFALAAAAASAIWTLELVTA
jgi:hypothetical protein